jgi:hypothetical protein
MNVVEGIQFLIDVIPGYNMSKQNCNKGPARFSVIIYL